MRFDPVDPVARDQAYAILKQVREEGLEGLISQAVKLGDIPSKDSKDLYSKSDLEDAFLSLDPEAQGVLQRTADRIRAFAMNQRKSLGDKILQYNPTVSTI